MNKIIHIYIGIMMDRFKLDYNENGCLRRRRKKQLREEMPDERETETETERERERDRETERERERQERIAIHFVDILYAVIPLQYINSMKYQEYHGKECSFYFLRGLLLKYFLFKNILK
jgi:predicted DsbA family dithiol-disulfide isomerase